MILEGSYSVLIQRLPIGFGPQAHTEQRCSFTWAIAGSDTESWGVVDLKDHSSAHHTVQAFSEISSTAGQVSQRTEPNITV